MYGGMGLNHVTVGYAIAQLVGHWLFTVKACFQSEDSLCGIYDGRSGTVKGFCSSFSVPTAKSIYTRPIEITVPMQLISPHSDS
jgi:hypothetical protein